MPIAQPMRSSPYDPSAELSRMGIGIVRCWLRDTLGVWSPQDQAVVVADGLSPIQERCVIAHELEHVLAGDMGCAGSRGVRAELLADRRAARKLVAVSDFYRAAQWAADEHELAEELQVTTWMVRARWADLEGGAQWRATSKIAG